MPFSIKSLDSVVVSFETGKCTVRYTYSPTEYPKLAFSDSVEITFKDSTTIADIKNAATSAAQAILTKV